MCGDGSSLIRWFQAGYSPSPGGFVPVWFMDKAKKHGITFIGLKPFWVAYGGIIAIKDSLSYYTLLIQTYASKFEMLGLSNWGKSIANILISNMPVLSDIMYFKDSHLLESYLISTITLGGGVNITMLTYNGRANIGLVCCSNNIDSLEPLLVSVTKRLKCLKNVSMAQV